MTEEEELQLDKEVAKDRRSESGDNTKSSGRDGKNRKEKIKPLTKVIIRRLPPTMTAEEFQKQIDPMPENDYFYFVSADWSLGLNASSRAYINFIKQEDIYIFRDKFDGYVFVDAKGTEYPAIVEFAPFQGLPKSKSRKKDNKCSTIESDPQFIAFMESLNSDDKDTGKPEMKMEYSYKIKDDKKITTTPLLEFLANKKQEKRDERKRKFDDKKKQRDEDKFRKKDQFVKSLPSAIQEEPDDDGIIVRVIKSRPLDRDRSDRNKRDRVFESKTDQSKNDDKKSQSSSSKNEDRDKNRSERDERRKGDRDKRENSRREKEQKYREERANRRKEEREKYRRERDSKKDEVVKDKENKEGAKKEETKVAKDEKVKKYSESRRERIAERSDVKTTADKSKNLSAKLESLIITSKTTADTTATDVKIAEPHEDNGQKVETKQCDEKKELDRQSSIESKSDSLSSGGGGGGGTTETSKEALRAAAKKERDMKRIRNKDRPSLQIYQPGKRRANSEDVIGQPAEPTTKTENSAAVSNLTEQKCDDKPEEVKVEENNPIVLVEKNNPIVVVEKNNPIVVVEKKVSRYSERRNKAKERKNIDILSDVPTELVQNTEDTDTTTALVGNNMDIQES